MIISGGREACATAWGVTPQAPEDRHLALPHFDRIAPIRRRDIRNAQRRWIAGVHGRAVDARIAGRDFVGFVDSICRDGPHADDHGTGKRTHGRAFDRGAVHRHDHVLLEVTQRECSVLQGILEGEAAAEQESHHVVLPVRQGIGGLSAARLPVDVHAVARGIAANVGAGSESKRLGVANRGALQERAWLGVGDAEGLEVVGQRRRQHDEVCLDVAGGQAGGGRSPRAIAARCPHGRTGFESFSGDHARVRGRFPPHPNLLPPGEKGPDRPYLRPISIDETGSEIPPDAKPPAHP